MINSGIVQSYSALLIEKLQQENEQLQTKLAESEARVVKLEVAASMDMRDLEDYGDLRMDRLRNYFGNPTGRQLLAESIAIIEAAAVEKAAEECSGFLAFEVVCRKQELLDYASQLRQQQTNGE